MRYPGRITSQVMISFLQESNMNMNNPLIYELWKAGLIKFCNWVWRRVEVFYEQIGGE